MAATGATAVALAPFTRPRIQPDVVDRSPPTTGVRFAFHPPSQKSWIHRNEAVRDHRNRPSRRALTGPPSLNPGMHPKILSNRAGNRPGRLLRFTRLPS